MINPKLLQKTQTVIYGYAPLIFKPSDIIVEDDWWKLPPKLDSLTSIEFVAFYNHCSPTNSTAIAKLTCMTIRGTDESFQDVRYALLSPSAGVYYRLYEAATKSNPYLVNNIEQVVRRKAVELNASMSINNVYREWFVRTVINNIELV